MNELRSHLGLGQICAVIGAQWGDEGKGKIIDLLAEHFDVIARACGGANAGHTIIANGVKRVFHLLPAGSLHPGKAVVLGAGMVLHLPTLLEEIRSVEETGVETLSRIHISPAAKIVFDFHKTIDSASEERRKTTSAGAFGTTRRGIGPAYMDKAARVAMTMGELRTGSPQQFREYLTRRSEEARSFRVSVDIDAELHHLLRAQQILRDRVVDTVRLLHTSLGEGKTILIEGAQGTLLDIDHGTYPFVTSSSTTVAGALQGLGLPPRALTSCIGVAKAYCTRVGEGPFPTEVTGEIGDRLRERGGEYGATTGRPRRCGWLHLPHLKYAAAINGVTCWNITKLDVLDEEEQIPVGVDEDGPAPRYEKLPGWSTSTHGITSFEELPPQGQAYLRFIEERTKVPVSFIGTGREREAMIVRM